MNPTDIRQAARQDIDRRLDGLRSSEEARHAMQRLTTDLQELWRLAQGQTPELQQAAAIFLTVQTYLERSLERTDLDGRVALETVNNLCWDKWHMVGEDLPEALLEEFGVASAYPTELAGVWRRNSATEYSLPLAELTAWWLVASAVADAVHAEAGEVVKSLSPLLTVFGAGQTDYLLH